MTKKTWQNIRTILPSVLLTLTAAWFTACEADEETTAGGQTLPQQHAITFGGTMGEMEEVQNRAESALKDHVQAFHLWGYKTMSYDDAAGYGKHQTVFDGYNLAYTPNSAGTTADNTSGWYYVGGTSLNSTAQTIKYWDYSATSYRFMATTGDADALEHSVVRSGSDYHATLSYAGLTPSAGALFSTLWFSNNAPAMPEYGKTVQLKFRSPYCKVRFMLVDESGNPLTGTSSVIPHITPGSLRFYPNNAARQIGNEGDLQITYPITGKSTGETFLVTPTNSISLTLPYESGNYAFATETDKEKWYTLFPSHTSSAFTLEMEYNGAPRKATVPAEFMMWDMNHEYTYVFKLTERKLEFVPSLSVFKEWQSGYTPDSPEEW